MNALKKVWMEEEGFEALQVVLITAIAALILAFLYKVIGGHEAGNATNTEYKGDTIVSWFTLRINEIVGWK